MSATRGKIGVKERAKAFEGAFDKSSAGLKIPSAQSKYPAPVPPPRKKKKAIASNGSSCSADNSPVIDRKEPTSHAPPLKPPVPSVRPSLAKRRSSLNKKTETTRQRSLSDFDSQTGNSGAPRLGSLPRGINKPKPSLPPKPSVPPKPKTLPKKTPPPRPRTSPAQSKTLPLRPKPPSNADKLPPPRPSRKISPKVLIQKGQDFRNSETRTTKNKVEQKEILVVNAEKGKSTNVVEADSLRNGERGDDTLNESFINNENQEEKEIPVIETNRISPLKTSLEVESVNIVKCEVGAKIDHQSGFNIAVEDENARSKQESTKTSNLDQEKEHVEQNIEITLNESFSFSHGSTSDEVKRNSGEIVTDPVCESKDAETGDKVDVSIGHPHNEQTPLQDFGKYEIASMHKEDQDNIKEPGDLVINKDGFKEESQTKEELAIIDFEAAQVSEASVSREGTDSLEEREKIDQTVNAQKDKSIDKFQNINQSNKKVEKNGEEPATLFDNMVPVYKDSYLVDEKDPSERKEKADGLTVESGGDDESLSLKSTEVEAEQGKNIEVETKHDKNVEVETKHDKNVEVETEQEKGVENDIVSAEELNVKNEYEDEQTCKTNSNNDVLTDHSQQFEETCESEENGDVERHEDMERDNNFEADVSVDVGGKEAFLDGKEEVLSENEKVLSMNTREHESAETKVEFDSNLTTFEQLILGGESGGTLEKPELENEKEPVWELKSNGEEKNKHETGNLLEENGDSLLEEKTVESEPMNNERDIGNLLEKSGNSFTELEATVKTESKESNEDIRLTAESGDFLPQEKMTIKIDTEKEEGDVKNLIEESSDSLLEDSLITVSVKPVKNEEEIENLVEGSGDSFPKDMSTTMESELGREEEDMNNSFKETGGFLTKDNLIIIESESEAYEEDRGKLVEENGGALPEDQIATATELINVAEGSEDQETKPDLLNLEQKSKTVNTEAENLNIPDDYMEDYQEEENEHEWVEDGPNPVRPVRSKRARKQRDNQINEYENVVIGDKLSIKPREELSSKIISAHSRGSSGYEEVVLKPQQKKKYDYSNKISDTSLTDFSVKTSEPIYYNVSTTSSISASPMSGDMPINTVKPSERDCYDVPVTSSPVSNLNYSPEYTVTTVSPAPLDSDAEYAVPKPHSNSDQSDYSVPVTAPETVRDTTDTAKLLEEYSVPKPHSSGFKSDYSVPSSTVDSKTTSYGLIGQDVDEELYSIPQISVASTASKLSESESCASMDMMYSVPSSQPADQVKIVTTSSEPSQVSENNQHLFSPNENNLYSVPQSSPVTVDRETSYRQSGEDYLVPTTKLQQSLEEENDNVYSVPQPTQPTVVTLNNDEYDKPPPKPPRLSSSDETEDKVDLENKPTEKQDKETTMYPVPACRAPSQPSSEIKAKDSPEPRPRKLPPGSDPVLPVAAPRMAGSTKTTEGGEKVPEALHDQSFPPSPRPRSRAISVEVCVHNSSRRPLSVPLPLTAEREEQSPSKAVSLSMQGSSDEVSTLQETPVVEKAQSLEVKEPSSISYAKSPKRRAPPPPRPPLPSDKRLSQISDSDSSSARTSLALHGPSSESESSDVDESGESLRHKQPQGPPKSKTQYIADEILSTEKTFVHALQLVYEECYSKIQEENVVTAAILNDIFRDLGNIYFLDCKFLQELEERMKTWDEHERIGDIIKKYSHFLKIYRTYINGYDKAMNTFMEIMKENPQFANLVNEFHASEKCHGMQIQSFMLKPVQRIPSYRLLLIDYLKHLPQDCEEYADTKVALDTVSEVATHINESMKKVDSSDKLLRIQNSLVSYHEIVKPGRYYITEGSLMKLCRKDMQERHFFLLTDVLLYCTPVGSTQYKLNSELPLLGMKVNLPDSSDFVNEFIITSTTRSFILLASTPEERDEWIETLNKAIEDQTKKKITFINKTAGHIDALPEEDFQLGQRAPVWIPDARVTMCMLCTVQFTVTNRRHHCRACGKVVCGSCSDNEAPLVYLDYNPSRVCDVCYGTLLKDFHTDAKVPDEESPTTTIMVRTDSLERERQEKKPNKIEMISRFRSTKKRKSQTPKASRPSVLLEVGGNEEGSQMSGYLKFKKGGRHFKRQWFVLKDNVLYAYKASSDVCAHETIPVLSYEVDEPRKDGNEIVFQLKHKGLTNLTFRAENQNSATRWVQELKKATTLGEA